MGGQTALNVATALYHDGTLDRFGVELIGAGERAIRVAEDRKEFAAAMEEADNAEDDRLQDEAVTRAIDGKSDALLKFLLASRMPDKYGAKVDHNFPGRRDGSRTVVELKADLAALVGEDVATLLTTLGMPAQPLEQNRRHAEPIRY